MKLPKQHVKGWFDEGKQHRAKCPKHNAWMRKGVCELCLVEQDRKRKAEESRKQ
jgi:hypothetical protein